jgi:hypothetical protein
MDETRMVEQFDLARIQPRQEIPIQIRLRLRRRLIEPAEMYRGAPFST